MITQFPVGYFRKQGGEFTKLLLHMNGTNNVFVDSSASGHDIFANGNVTQVSTPSSPLTDGGNVGSFDGSGDFLSIPDSVDWDFGTGDFTIDYRFRVVNLSNPDTAGIVLAGSNDSLHTFVHNNGFVDFRHNDGVDHQLVSGNGSVLANIWYHYAIVRDGDVFKLYLDGIEKATNTWVITVNFGAIKIGSNNNTIQDFHNGSIEEFRISKGIARWTSNFTPPTQAYS